MADPAAGPRAGAGAVTEAPRPLSGPALAVYLGLILYTTVVVFVVVLVVGPTLHGDVAGLRQGLHLR